MLGFKMGSFQFRNGKLPVMGKEFRIHSQTTQMMLSKGLFGSQSPGENLLTIGTSTGLTGLYAIISNQAHTHNASYRWRVPPE